MTLSDQQRVFTLLAARLITHAYAEGYTMSFGEAWRPTETAQLYARQGRGITNSLHRDRLAIDLNLFKDGALLSRSEDHEPLGIWWEKQHALCRWGGRFRNAQGLPRPDGNHYSMIFDGRS